MKKVKAEKLTVQSVAKEPSIENQGVANAHLIASAPELLEACKLALMYLEENDCGEDTRYLRPIEQAITKAEGK